MLPSLFRRRLGRRALGSAAVVAATLAAAVVGAGSAAAAPTQCREVSFPVRLAALSGSIHGTLCAPPEARTLQILVHGHSYNRSYWDSPYEPERYSYVRRATEHGYATLAIDRIGTGTSWRPPSVATTLDANVDTVGQVVEAVARGEVGGFEHLVLVGHSYGTLTAYGVAGDPRAGRHLDAVVATGGSHGIDYAYAGLAYFPFVRPAVTDPAFADRAPDPAYVVAAPGKHNVFVNAANTDPALLELNEGALKDTGTLEELATLGTHTVQNLTPLRSSAPVNIPILAINGAEDPFFCGPPLAADCSSGEALARYERPFFGPDAQVEGVVLPGTGHGFAIERTAPIAYDAMLDFVDRHVGV
ncbi:alpha/beta hydrolase [Pseudonocardia endophytica]|uniref:Pimeloyl-ACP methyl ester carboxylesterase n=1 Tax=Pseudonocardia endophytica TaxID=401976 RepID=A0A4R1HVJ5_PSEEN|nr:alpha/beta hydrolase [Pseudonocardia endophytica]TCK26298.1 pimeloyl-ACP methyl ester carboxylesterase [Pseudonocardia endophytica]